jgi:coenzyme F420-reducing hydrogenase alpha subunit
MTNETEVLRISGNVTIDKGYSFSDSFYEYLMNSDSVHSHAVNVVPQDDESGMRLYRVEEVEDLKKQVHIFESLARHNQTMFEAGHNAFLSLSEELAQERERSKRGDKALELLDEMYGLRLIRLEAQSKRIQALQKRLELAENNRWRTFIKWWKELWKKLYYKIF